MDAHQNRHGSIGGGNLLEGYKVRAGVRAQPVVLLGQHHAQKSQLTQLGYQRRLEVGKKEDKLGLRASPTVQLNFDNMRVPASNLLGDETQGFVYAMQSLDNGRLGIAAQAIGIARAALEHSVVYAAERKQFGKPLKEFEAIQFKLADMAMRVAGSRALLHAAAAARDRGQNVGQFSSMAKLMASETAMWVTTQAVQIFGGYGYVKDYPVERLMRDAKVTEIYEGTSEIQRIVIARALYSHA